MGWFAFVVVVLGAAVLGWRARGSAARQRRLMLLCRRAGVEFAPLDPFPDTAWLPFPMFGHTRQGTENVVWDRREGDVVRAFDLWYQDEADGRTAGGRHRSTCAVVPLAVSCPSMRVTPRDAVEDALSVISGNELRLELEEFDRRFHVETDDPRFAIAFLDQRMMEAFLGLPDDVTIDVNEDALLLHAPRLSPERMLLLLDAAAAIRRRIPRVVASLYPPRPSRGPHEARWLQGRWAPEPTGDVAAGLE